MLFKNYWSSFKKYKSERDARKEAENVDHQNKVTTSTEADSGEGSESSGIDALFAAISKSKATTYRVILKADVRGSLEALEGSLELIKSDKVLLEVLQSEVGQVTKNDVKMANTSKADILGFNVKLENENSEDLSIWTCINIALTFRRPMTYDNHPIPSNPSIPSTKPL